MKTLTLTFHSDPGHGWLQVDRHLLKELGIESNISNCSYMHGEQVYLEEDMDADTFVTKASDLGWKLVIESINWENGAPCRNYRSYVPIEIRNY